MISAGYDKDIVLRIRSIKIRSFKDNNNYRHNYQNAGSGNDVKDNDNENY